MKNIVSAFIACLLLLIFVAFFIYPTPYKYLEFHGANGVSTPVKYNWITGKTQMLRFDTSSQRTEWIGDNK